MLLAGAGATGYARYELVDGHAFGGRVAAGLTNDAVHAEVSRRVVDSLVRSAPNLLTVRPVVTRVVGRVVGSSVFASAVAQGVEAAHPALISGPSPFVLRLDEGSAAVVAAVRRVSPRVAREIPPGFTPRLARVAAADLRWAHAVHDVARWWWAFLLAALASGVACFLVAGAGRRAITYLGAAAAGAGLTVVAVTTIVGNVLAATVRERSGVPTNVTDGLWSAVMGDLSTGMLIVAAAGFAAAVMGSGVLRRRRESDRRVRFIAPLVVVTALAAVLVGAVLVLPLAYRAQLESPADTAQCNGSQALCDRRLNEVAFAATHNSYAAADEPDWYFPNQRFGIARQLRDGVRAFLIDIHFGVLDKRAGLERTDLTAEGSDRNKVAAALGPQAMRAADRLAGRIGVTPVKGNPSLYLCHTLCELGAEPLDQELLVVRRFLDTHPGVVVIFVIEPYVPVAATEKAMARTGLLAQAAHLKLGMPLPTLGALVRADTRLIVFSEQDGGSRPWYLDGFAFVQDTPYNARNQAELSCRRLRGTADSPLLLINHWIATFPPSPSRNALVGGDFLPRRLARCGRERGMLPNLVAVDFYDRSGVVAAVAALNDGTG